MMYSDEAVEELEVLVEKIRYAMSYEVQNIYVLELLKMFDEETGRFKNECGRPIKKGRSPFYS